MFPYTMTVSALYPQDVALLDGTIVQTTDETWDKRQLVVETDRSESEVRGMLRKEGFVESTMEYNKPGRLGSGMEKKFQDWQVHVRLFRHGEHIQIDGEIEVSGNYWEHLTHGWLPALKICVDMVSKHFTKCWVYHKKYRQYVTGWAYEHVLRLVEPKSKTDVVMTVAIAGVAVACIVLLASLSKSK